MLPPAGLNERPQYRGRFAPSPSGHLHFGSLVTALASFLDAKANNGVWLVRIEDIDPPRELAGASEHILATLHAYGMHWDEKVLYQSTQHAYYDDILKALEDKALSYACHCTRAQIKAMGGIYQALCKNKHLPHKNNAIRLVNQSGVYDYLDLIQQHVSCDKKLACEDFTLVRKDGLYAYQLAVVADDIFQKITHVIRGCDLLEPTARQLTFFKQLNCQPPIYGHIPLAVTNEGYKLSKQNKAPAINTAQPQPSLIAALKYLGQKPPATLLHSTTDEIIQWAIQHWSLAQVPQVKKIALEQG